MLTKSIPHTFVRNGYYYFSRRVPSDLRDHYSYHRIVQGLRTTSPQKARVQANIASAKLDAYWGQMRLAKSEVIGMSLVSSRPNDNLEVALGPSQPVCPSLLDALAVYLEYKGKGRPKTFRLAAERSCNYVIGLCGNKPLSQYTRQDALHFRDWLVARGLTGSSVTRNFSYLKAVINFALSEYALDVRNPFVGVYHDRSAGVLTRKPIPIEDIRKVQNQCRLIDDDLRWLVALVSDTGMRLAEGAGLLKSDILLDADILHISLKPHSWRPLKTSGSKRDIPLVGASLWAAQRLSESFPDSPYAFPRYNRKDTTNSNSASAALNKWLHQYVPEGCTMHSFRHSMRDRLRAVECPSDVIDQIGGWATEGVGQGYGEGYELKVCARWMQCIALHD